MRSPREGLQIEKKKRSGTEPWGTLRSKDYGKDEKPGKEVDLWLMASKVEDSEERMTMRMPSEAGVFKKGGSET